MRNHFLKWVSSWRRSGCLKWLGINASSLTKPALAVNTISGKWGRGLSSSISAKLDKDPNKLCHCFLALSGSMFPRLLVIQGLMLYSTRNNPGGMRNRNFTAYLRTRRPGIYLDASLNKLGCKIYDGRKAKGEQAGLTNRLFP